MKYSKWEKIKMAQELIARAIMVSETTKHDAFIHYSPHVDWIEVAIYHNGWKMGALYDMEFRINWNNSDAWRNYKAAIKALDELEEDKADGPEEESPGDAGTSPELKDNTLDEI